MAKKFAKAEVINYEEVNAGEALKQMTGGRGTDACIDGVGLLCRWFRIKNLIHPLL